MAIKLTKSYDTADAVDEMLAGMTEAKPVSKSSAKPTSRPKATKKPVKKAPVIPVAQQQPSENNSAEDALYALFVRVDPVLEKALFLRKQYPKAKADKSNASIVEAALREYLAEEIELAEMLEQRMAGDN